jgi:hypothetical protein
MQRPDESMEQAVSNVVRLEEPVLLDKDDQIEHLDKSPANTFVRLR